MSKETSPESSGPADPAASEAGQSGRPSHVRDRTLRHMRTLLAKTAATGAILSLSGSSCVVCDPLPPPVDCTVTPDHPDCPPVVCDPLPPPVERATNPDDPNCPPEAETTEEQDPE